MKTNINKIVTVTAGFALIASMMIASSAYAENSNNNNRGQERKNSPIEYRGNGEISKIDMKSAFVGKVISINGTSITMTVVGHQNLPNKATSTLTNPITYTVNASNATVFKKNATTTLSSIVVGDQIVVQGTVNGTNIVATKIRDTDKLEKDNKATSTNPIFNGNGQPVVAGKIATVNGNSITITTASNITYTVDVTNAKVLKDKYVSTIAGLVVGDTVVIQGSINGSSVIASTILDNTNIKSVNPSPMKAEGSKGFFRGIGRFFMGMFGF
jgi:hypothetical protein